MSIENLHSGSVCSGNSFILPDLVNICTFSKATYYYILLSLPYFKYFLSIS